MHFLIKSALLLACIFYHSWWIKDEYITTGIHIYGKQVNSFIPIFCVTMFLASKSCGESLYLMRQLRRVRRSLDADSAKTLVHAFVMSHVDCCNTLLAWSLNYMTDRLQQILNAAACFGYLRVQPGHFWCTTICTGSTFQSVSTTSWMLLCIVACRRKLRRTWSTVAHQFLKSPDVDTLSQSTTPYCATALPVEHVRVPSGLFGSPVLLRGTLYLIVSVIQHWVLTVFEETTSNGIICELLNTLSAVEMIRDYVIGIDTGAANFEIQFIAIGFMLHAPPAEIPQTLFLPRLDELPSLELRQFVAQLPTEPQRLENLAGSLLTFRDALGVSTGCRPHIHGGRRVGVCKSLSRVADTRRRLCLIQFY